MNETEFRKTLMIILNIYLDNHTNDDYERKYVRAAITTNLVEAITSSRKMQGIVH